MKQILFFIPTLGGGGAEKVLVDLVNNMDRKKFDITLLTLFDGGVNKSSLSDRVKYRFVFKHVFRGNTHVLKLFTPSFLYRKMIKESYDVVVSYLQSPVMRIVGGCEDKHTKIVSWIHNEFRDTKPLERLYRNETEFKNSIDRYDAFVFVAESARNDLISCCPQIEKKSYTLYNTVDSDIIRTRSAEKICMNLDDNVVKLISVGRFAKQKAFDRLIKILARLRDNGYSVSLTILGDGELRKEYEALIDYLALKKYVRLPGYKDNPYKYVRNSDLFVCSSLHEGFSTAVTESLIVGTPVITTECSGMRELLGDNEYGVITENSEEALYKGIKKIIDDNLIPELKEKAIIRGKVFSKDVTVKKTEEFFAGL